MDNREINGSPSPYQALTLDILMPSGFGITIREQNGEDDDVLSRLGDARDGSSLNNFLAGIIINNSLKPEGKTRSEDFLDWKLKDKYYLLLKSRIFSLGSELIFDYTFKDGTTVKFEEDLSKFDWDLNKPLPVVGDKNYFNKRITPYKNGQEKYRNITLSSGKEIRYEYLTGFGEKYILDMNEDDISKNDELRARRLSLKMNNTYQILESFKLLSTRDMMEIRRDMIDNDGEFSLGIDLKNPKDQTIENISLTTLGSFFYPTNTMNI